MKRRMLLLLVFGLLGSLALRAQEGYRLAGQRFAAAGDVVSIPSTSMAVAWQAGGMALPEMRDGTGGTTFGPAPLLALPLLRDPGITPPPPLPDKTTAVEDGSSPSCLSLTLQPNPASEVVRVALGSAGFPAGSRLELYSAMGQRMLIVPTEGVASCLLDVRTLPGGLYVIRSILPTGAPHGVGRLLVVR